MLTTKEFLARILPPQGDDWYCWCTPAPANDPKGRRYIQRFTKYRAQIVDGVHQNDELEKNTYYALASFKERGTRKQDNVAFLKAFWLDIDCGEAKADAGQGYATKGQALTALFAATKTIGLPLPLVVDSGNGLHCYWPLTAAIPAEVWQPIAYRLIAAYQSQGLIADWGCSADHSRILRPVGTHNWKDPSNPKLVVVKLDRADNALETIEGPLAGIIVSLPASRSNDLGVNSDLGLPVEAPSSIPDLVANKCAQVGRFRDEHGCVPEPEWRAGLSIIKACVDGVETAHAWSSGYPLYRFAETQEKLDQIKGPYTCATFARYNPADCVGCKYSGKITSPIQLGRPEEFEEVVEDEVVEQPIATPSIIQQVVDGKVAYPSLPRALINNGYAWTTEGMCIKMMVEDASGEKISKHVPFTDAFFYCDEIITLPNVGKVARFTVQARRGQPFATLDIPTGVVYAKDQLLKVIATQGLGYFAGREKEFVMFMQKWYDEVRQRARETMQHTHYGWQENGGFLIGDRLALPGRPLSNVAVGGDARTALSIMSQGGTPADWTRLVNTLYTGAGMEQYQFILACGFGAPLMRFTPSKGVTVDMVSEASGVGKTTAAKVALSIWGEPDGMSMTCGQATNTAIFTRLSVMSSLPCYLDEITKATPEFLGALAYDVTSGKPKDRGNQNGSMKDLAQGWNTIMLASGNTSMIGRISSGRGAADPEMMRVFEFQMSPRFVEEQSVARTMFAELARCYGTVGEVYAQYLVDHADEIQKMIDKVMSAIERKAKVSSVERFWLAGVAAAITGAQIATKLGLVAFDVNALLDWCVEHIVESRRTVAATTRTSEETFALMLQDLNGGVIVTDTRGGNGTLAFAMKIPFKIVGRRIVDEGKVWLSVEGAKRWCADNNADYGAMLSSAKANGTVIGGETFDLGVNTDASTVPTKCLVIKQ